MAETILIYKRNQSYDDFLVDEFYKPEISAERVQHLKMSMKKGMWVRDFNLGAWSILKWVGSKKKEAEIDNLKLQVDSMSNYSDYGKFYTIQINDI